MIINQENQKVGTQINVTYDKKQLRDKVIEAVKAKRWPRGELYYDEVIIAIEDVFRGEK